MKMNNEITLKKAADDFIGWLEQLGKTPSTISTSRRTLDLLIAELGDDKIVKKILPVHISKFFKSDTATMQRGKPRAEASVLQIRRIVRQFLLWCVEQNYLEKSALPKKEAARGGGVRIPVSEDTEAIDQQESVE